MKSARINFGIGAESEYVLEVDDTGVATRCFNPVTGQELGVGGSDLPDVTVADAGKVLTVDESGEWAAEQYAGYDAVIEMQFYSDESVLEDYNILKGSYSNIISKYGVGKYGPIILVKLFVSDTNHYYITNTLETYIDGGNIIMIIGADFPGFAWTSSNIIQID